MSTAPQTKTLSDLSAETRRDLAPQRSFGDGLQAAYRQREDRQITALAYTAASLAAAERRRHGRDSTPDERQDAAQDALAAAYSTAEPIRPVCEVHPPADRIPASYWQQGTSISPACFRCRDCAYSGETDAEMVPLPSGAIRPKLADLIDPDRQTVSSFDGSREGLRPGPAMIAAAGASLDRAHSERALLDPAAGSGDLLAAAAESRQEAENRRRRKVADQLADPSVSPVPEPVDTAIRQAGIWPTDPARQAILDALCPDLTAADWHLCGEGTESAVITRRKRAKGGAILLVDPHARTFADLLAAELEPTDAERAELERRAAESILSANPDGPRQEAASLRDPAWRTGQPMISPLYVNGELVPTDGQDA